MPSTAAERTLASTLHGGHKRPRGCNRNYAVRLPTNAIHMPDGSAARLRLLLENDVRDPEVLTREDHDRRLVGEVSLTTDPDLVGSGGDGQGFRRRADDGVVDDDLPGGDGEQAQVLMDAPRGCSFGRTRTESA